jgi:hypothetical protein
MTVKVLKKKNNMAFKMKKFSGFGNSPMKQEKKVTAKFESKRKKDKDNRFNQYENLFPKSKHFKDKGFDHNTKELEKIFKNKNISQYKNLLPKNTSVPGLDKFIYENTPYKPTNPRLKNIKKKK